MLVRVHSECLTGDAFGSLKCDCGEQLDLAIRMMFENGSGALVYLRQEGRGIGLHNKIRAYALQEQGLDTIEANVALGFQPDERKYDLAVQIMRDLNIFRARLVTNNPHKMAGISGLGVQVTDRIGPDRAAQRIQRTLPAHQAGQHGAFGVVDAAQPAGHRRLTDLCRHLLG